MVDWDKEGGEKDIHKCAYLENESFLGEIKSISHNFLRAIIWWEKKLADAGLKNTIKTPERCK